MVVALDHWPWWHIWATDKFLLVPDLKQAAKLLLKQRVALKSTYHLQPDVEAVLAITRKMLRRIVGWRRVEGERWEDTMRRMNHRLAFDEQLYFCQPWSIMFARMQWRYCLRVVRASSLAWQYHLRRHNVIPKIDPASPHLPYRNRGRPLLRWDDHIRCFCTLTWPARYGRHWNDIMNFEGNKLFQSSFF